MNYDENVFKAKANIKARRIWLVFSLLLTANYGADMSNGLYPSKQYLYFVLLCWIPFFIGELFLKIKGKTTGAWLRYLLYLSFMYHSIPNCIYLHSAGNQSFNYF